MKNIVAMLVVVLLAWALPNFADVTSSNDVVVKVLKSRGDEYREIISKTSDLTSLQNELQQINDSLEAQLLTKVVASRISHPDVFREYEEFLVHWRGRMNSPTKGIGTRCGYMSGMFRNFTKKGIVSRFVEVHLARKLTSLGWKTPTKLVKKHTEAEVHTGKARNKAARMALLEHLLKFSDEGNDYEQMELVDAVIDIWSKGNSKHFDEVDGIYSEAVLRYIVNDKTQPLAVRVEPLYMYQNYFSVNECLRSDIFIGVLQSTSFNNMRRYKLAVEYFKKNSPETLKTIKPEVYWKKVMVCKAAGLPIPEPKIEVKELDLDFSPPAPTPAPIPARKRKPRR